MNRNGFADPDWSATSNDGDCDFVEPKSPIEEKITNKCCELLGKKIGMEEDESMLQRMHTCIVADIHVFTGERAV